MKKYLLVLIITGLFITPKVYSQEEKQDKELHQLTLEQKYERAESNYFALTIAALSYAKSKGDTPEEFGKFIGETHAKGWNPGDTDPLELLVSGMNWNMNLFKDFQMEILERSESSAKIKWNKDWAYPVKDRGMDNFGATLDEFHTYVEQIWIAIANRLGLDYKQEFKEDSIIVTIKKK